MSPSGNPDFCVDMLKARWLLRVFAERRPIYTEELPGVAAHDSLLVLLCRVILRSCTDRHGNSWAQWSKQRIVRGYSWQLLSVDWREGSCGCSCLKCTCWKLKGCTADKSYVQAWQHYPTIKILLLLLSNILVLFAFLLRHGRLVFFNLFFFNFNFLEQSPSEIRLLLSTFARAAARIFLRGGAEVMEAKALKRKNCLWLE